MNIACNELKLKIKNMKKSKLLRSKLNFPEFSKEITNSRISWKIFPLLCNNSEKRVKKVRPPLVSQHKTITPPKHKNPPVE